MKKSLLVLTFVAAAGTATAQTAPSVRSGGGASQPVTLSLAVVPQAPPPTSAGVRTPSAGSPRANPPTAAAAGVTTPGTNPPSVTTPVSSAPSIATAPPASSSSAGTGGEAQARAALEQDGYKMVGGLTRGADGIWRGTAMRGSTSVPLQVDAAGNVSTQ